jgi:hypothetical protein
MKLNLFNILSGIALLGCSAKNQSDHRFYNFDIALSIRNPFIGVTEKYILSNTSSTYAEEEKGKWHTANFKNNTLYFITYKPSLDRGKNESNITNPVDTLGISLRRGQMDTLYIFTSRLFPRAGFENLTTNSVYSPPGVYDGISAIIDFNQGDRGHRYRIRIDEADNLPLHSYMKEIIARYKKQPSQ